MYLSHALILQQSFPSIHEIHSDSGKPRSTAQSKTALSIPNLPLSSLTHEWSSVTLAAYSRVPLTRPQSNLHSSIQVNGTDIGWDLALRSHLVRHFLPSAILWCDKIEMLVCLFCFPFLCFHLHCFHYFFDKSIPTSNHSTIRWYLYSAQQGAWQIVCAWGILIVPFLPLSLLYSLSALLMVSW